jgi:hypothetical protein
VAELGHRAAAYTFLDPEVLHATWNELAHRVPAGHAASVHAGRGCGRQERPDSLQLPLENNNAGREPYVTLSASDTPHSHREQSVPSQRATLGPGEVLSTSLKLQLLPKCCVNVAHLIDDAIT